MYLVVIYILFAFRLVIWRVGKHTADRVYRHLYTGNGEKNKLPLAYWFRKQADCVMTRWHSLLEDGRHENRGAPAVSAMNKVFTSTIPLLINKLLSCRLVSSSRILHVRR
jgi:hypothetical protein